MKCHHCQGVLEYRSAPFHISRRGYHVSLDTVPAWVCTQCGEVFYDEGAVETIQQTLHALDKQMEQMRVAA